MNLPPSLFPQLLAQSQQDAVLEAINKSVRNETPVWVVWALFGVAFAGIALVAIAGRMRRNRPIEPVRKAMHNPKKLLKETAETLALSPAELRKLEHHAAKAGVENPLTLLLCPSLVKKDKQ